MQLRPFQETFVSDISSAYRSGANSVLGCAPTGAGKTVVMAHIIRALVGGGARPLVVCHRDELVQQTSSKLRAYGVDHGICTGSAKHGSHLPTQVATIQTAIRRQFTPNWLIFDEAHLSKADSWVTLRNEYQDARLLGFSATPVRLDGRGFGDMYQSLVLGPSTKSLIELGFLTPYRLFAPTIPDLSNVSITAGDYNQGQLAEEMEKPGIVGDIVSHWKTIASDRLTLVFAVNRNHARIISEAFNNSGIPSECIDGSMPRGERKAILDRFGKTTRVLVSVLLFTEGFDRPEIGAIILARPTKSLALFLQMCGRGLRIHPGKSDCIILDHAGNSVDRHGNLVHGFPDDERQWSLDSKKKRKSKDAALPPERLPRVCPECHAVHPWNTVTCWCGYKFTQVRAAVPMEHAGELVEITDKAAYRMEDYLAQYGAPVPEDDKAVADIIKQCHAKGHKPAAVHFRVRALEQARNEYRQATGRDPQPYWSSAAINNMLELPKRA